MAESKHGGSPESGIAQPVGIDSLEKVSPASLLFKPAAARSAEEAKERARQFARRNLAEKFVNEVYAEMDAAGMSEEQLAKNTISMSLRLADELIAQTGGHTTGVGQQ